MGKREYEFLDDKSRALMRESFWGQTLLLILVSALILALILWAAFGVINEHVTAAGKVIPSSYVQDIQNLEGGIIKKILVREGEKVKKGQLLIQLDITQYEAAYKKELIKYNTYLAKKTRLEAEATDQKNIIFPKILKEKFPTLVNNEEKLFRVNRNNFEANIRSLTKSYNLAKQQLDMTEPLVKRGVLPKFDLLKIQREVSDIKGKLDVARESYYSDVRTKLTDVNAELDASKKQLGALEDRIERAAITAPVDGIVKKINFDTIGAVVKPGDIILEIVPIDEQLIIEAKVLPKDIGFIDVGQPANIKISAYDSTIYGGLEGKVTHISADSILEANKQGREINYFRVFIKTDVNYLEYKGKKLPITPGMETTIDIITGKRSILQYILRPIIKTQQSVTGKV